MREKLYFAYGSNINLDQMARRCPAAQAITPVTLNGYQLVFRGRMGNNGVATIVPNLTKQVKGLLWEITPACERALDQYEGFPTLYGKQNVKVMDKDGKAYTVMAYVMTREFELEPAYPSMSYYTGIAQGYAQNGIPAKGLSEALTLCRREVDRWRESECDRFGLLSARRGKPKHGDHER